MVLISNGEEDGGQCGINWKFNEITIVDANRLMLGTFSIILQESRWRAGDVYAHRAPRSPSWLPYGKSCEITASCFG